MLTTEFILTSLAVVLLPGTGTLYTISTGLFGGRRASIAAAIGCTLGIVPHVAISVLGLSLVVHLSALLFDGLKLLGAAYLLYLAWTTWHDGGALHFEGEGRVQSGWQIIGRAVALNVLNPKLTIFFVAFLPLFITPAAASPTRDLCVLSAAFMALTFVVFVGYGLVASAVRAYVIGAPRALGWLRRSFALLFAAMAVQLATAGR